MASIRNINSCEDLVWNPSFYLLKNVYVAGRIVQWVEELFIKTDDLSLIPQTHVVKGEH